MFAVVEDGSRQYRVQEGESLTIDYRATAQKGDSISFDRVLLANGGEQSAIGHPVIEGAVVEAEILEPELKGQKLEIQKIRRRKNSRRHTGHRQKYTTVRITAIKVPGLKIAAIETADKPEPAEQAKAVEKPEETGEQTQENTV
jgi:large subunit ribosomal protein L21